MCNNFPNIRITEGNNFSLVLTLRSRTYVATKPIDEDIDPEQLENVVVTFGGVEYHAQRTAQGVQIDLPATLAVGTYNILLTADYLESKIRAAYESAVTIVPWSAQSTAEQYIAGSPIVLRAAYVLSGALTDAELEALKEEYREKIAEAEQAKADADAAKEHYDQLAEEISGVAQEATLTQGVQNIREDISHINIDTTDLAKEATIGTPLVGQPSTLFAAIAAIGQGDDAKRTIVDAIIAIGGSASASMTWAQLNNSILNLPLMPLKGSELAEGQTADVVDIGAWYCMLGNVAQKNIFRVVRTSAKITPPSHFVSGMDKLEEIYLYEVTILGNENFYSCSARIISIPKVAIITGYTFQDCTKIEELDLGGLNTTIPSSAFHGTNVAAKLIDLKTGANFVGNMSTNYNPTVAYNQASSSLCYATDLEKYGQLFSTNWDKWKWCIINHFAANLQDRTGMAAYTITFGSTVLSHFDTEMIAAFTNKNWTLS